MKKAVAFRTFAFLAIMALVAYPTFAQGGNRPGGGQRPDGGQRPGGRMGGQMTEADVKERVKRQSQALELNQEQEKKIMDFEIEMYKKNQVERQRLQGDREAMREYMREQRELRDQKYEEVLTEEQLNTYQERQQERRERMEQRRNRAPGDRPDGGDRPARGRGRR
jgi:Spy/CpxP family protein refolding chaperone